MRPGNADPRCFPHDVYRARGDDRWLAIAVRCEAEWTALAGAIPALAAYSGVDLAERRANAEQINAALAAWMRERDADPSAVQLQRLGVPASASAAATDLLADDHLRDRQFFPPSFAGERPARLAAIPWLLDGTRGRPLDPASPLGAATHALLHEAFGYDTPAVEHLRAAGVVA
jgi:benzylsuccinate CoA-transferase BbsF subunit